MNMSLENLGDSIPANTTHAVSVSLPTWRANVSYEEAEDWVINKLTTGYPRFFIHKLITAFADNVQEKYGREGEQIMLFPSFTVAKRCADFIYAQDPSAQSTKIRIINLRLDPRKPTKAALKKIRPSISAVIFPEESFPTAKQYWQHSGDGISSRRAEFCHGLFQEGLLVEEAALESIENDGQRLCKGPRRYQRRSSTDKTPEQVVNGHDSNLVNDPGTSLTNDNSENRESTQFVEERYGRNLDVFFVDNARSAIRRRIARSLVGEMDVSIRGEIDLSEEDVYLYSCGMNSIFNTHQMLLELRGSLKSIMFGFPYVDTLKILEKFGPGCLFYGHGSTEELDDLERRLNAGERYLALFCEFPGNPLLKSADLRRIKALADAFNFVVVIDETIGNFINIHVLPYADVVVSSLTKVFTGECNVMGGSAILNPHGRYYQGLKDVVTDLYEDNYWAEDVIFMERNSRDFISRIERINRNAEMICEVLQAHPLVKYVYYPKLVPSRPNYDACRTPTGGYGGLLSVTFHHRDHAIAFFDEIHTAKGPSLGTNFTLTSPYVILAHYAELEWAASFGIEAHLIRVSVGLEDAEELRSIFVDALKAVEGLN